MARGARATAAARSSRLIWGVGVLWGGIMVLALSSLIVEWTGSRASGSGAADPGRAGSVLPARSTGSSSPCADPEPSVDRSAATGRGTGRRGADDRLARTTEAVSSDGVPGPETAGASSPRPGAIDPVLDQVAPLVLSSLRPGEHPPGTREEVRRVVRSEVMAGAADRFLAAVARGDMAAPGAGGAADLAEQISALAGRIEEARATGRPDHLGFEDPASPR